MKTNLTDLNRRKKLFVFSIIFLIGLSTLLSSNQYIKVFGIILLVFLGLIAKISNFRKVSAKKKGN